MHTLSGLPRTGIVERGADRGGIRERRVFPGLRRWPPGRRTRVDAARDRGQPRRAHSAAGVRPGRVHPGRRAADLLELTRRDSLTAAGTVHIVSKQQYPERRRGFWPCDAPGNLVACRQGANASPATGTIRVEPSKLRRADPSLWRGVSFLAPGRHGQSPPAREEHMALSLPDPTFDAESTRRLYPNLALFEGFPYLVTRVVPAMYHVMLVPEEASELELVLLARTQWRANRLETCLVTGVDRAWFISADGRDELAKTPPRGGTLVTGLLKPATLWAATAELQ